MNLFFPTIYWGKRFLTWRMMSRDGFNAARRERAGHPQGYVRQPLGLHWEVLQRHPRDDQCAHRGRGRWGLHPRQSGQSLRLCLHVQPQRVEGKRRPSRARGTHLLAFYVSVRKSVKSCLKMKEENCADLTILVGDQFLRYVNNMRLILWIYQSLNDIIQMREEDVALWIKIRSEPVKNDISLVLELKRKAYHGKKTNLS